MAYLSDTREKREWKREKGEMKSREERKEKQYKKNDKRLFTEYYLVNQIGIGKTSAVCTMIQNLKKVDQVCSEKPSPRSLNGGCFLYFSL